MSCPVSCPVLYTLSVYQWSGMEFELSGIFSLVENWLNLDSLPPSRSCVSFLRGLCPNGTEFSVLSVQVSTAAAMEGMDSDIECSVRM